MLYHPPPPGGALPRRDPTSVFQSQAGVALARTYARFPQPAYGRVPHPPVGPALHTFLKDSKARINRALRGALRLVRYRDGSALLIAIMANKTIQICPEIFDDTAPNTALEAWEATDWSVSAPQAWGYESAEARPALWMPDRPLLCARTCDLYGQVWGQILLAMGAPFERHCHIPALAPTASGHWSLLDTLPPTQAEAARVAISALAAAGTLRPHDLLFVNEWDTTTHTLHLPAPATRHSHLQQAKEGMAWMAKAHTIPSFWAPDPPGM